MSRNSREHPCHVSRAPPRARGRASSTTAPPQSARSACAMPPQGHEKEDMREDRLQGPMRPMHREEEYVRKQMLKDARDKCDEPRAAYIECAKDRTFTLPFMCRTLFKDFNACLSQYTTDEEFDRRIVAYKLAQPSSALAKASAADVTPSDLMTTKR